MKKKKNRRKNKVFKAIKGWAGNFVSVDLKYIRYVPRKVKVFGYVLMLPGYELRIENRDYVYLFKGKKPKKVMVKDIKIKDKPINPVDPVKPKKNK